MPPKFASEESLANLRLVVDKHDQDDREFRERMFTYLREEFTSLKKSMNDANTVLQSSVNDTNAKVGTLWDDMNQRQGASHNRRITRSFAGWAANAAIAIIAAWATIKSVGK